MPKLNNWSVTPNPFGDPWSPPEVQGKCLHGAVEDDPRFSNGDEITTSCIASVALSLDGEMHVTTMSGSVYQLADVDPGYEAAYPNAAQRMYDSFSTQRSMA